MTNPTPTVDEELRRRAEETLARHGEQSLVIGMAASADAMTHQLHELQVHQIELQMQNEELRQTQLDLDCERARYFDLFDLAPVGYCTVNEQDLILEANFAAAALLQCVRSDLVKQMVSRFILQTNQDIYYHCRKALFESGTTQDCELQMLTRERTPVWVHLKTSLAHDASGAAVQRVTLIDISERKKAELALKEKAQELEDARKVAHQASLAKSAFLSSMTHELRSPLNAILGFSQLIEIGTPAPTPTQKNSLEQISRAGWYLLDLISEVLDLASVESEQAKLALEPVALAEILQDCHAMMAPLAQTTGVDVVFDPMDQAYCVLADRTRLKQVIVNLLSNAIKYNRVGGSVAVTCAQQPGQRLRVSVRDTGEGLPDEKVCHLFQAFNRLGRETRSEEGTGIGLAVSKRLVELMGGAIGVQSTVGLGSVFWFELNIQKEAP